MTLSEINIYVREQNADGYLIYLPLARYAKVLRKEQMLQLKECCERNELDKFPNSELKNYIGKTLVPSKNIFLTEYDIEGFTNMMILPNNICNFKCTYCYSAQGRSGNAIDLNSLKSAINYFLNRRQPQGRRFTISILGGGEPLLSWPLLKEALDYAYSLADEHRLSLPISIVTNGSIFSYDIANYMKMHNVSLGVSFDILPEIQNRQRGHYETVKSNINQFTEAGVDVALNAVITLENIDRMNDMLDAMVTNTPRIKKVFFKSLISDNYFSSPKERMNYYRRFVDNFFEALDKAKEYGIWLTSPYLNNAMCVSDRFCPGIFVVTSDGDISICPCIGSRKDKLFDKFIYGHISENGKVEINDKKLKLILSHNHNRNERCRDCIAHWHCAGGCYADNSTIGDDHDAQNAYCESMQYFIERYIKKYIL